MFQFSTQLGCENQVWLGAFLVTILASVAEAQITHGVTELDPAAVDDATTSDQLRSRETLFQWSCNPSYEGGPKLDKPFLTDRPDFTETSSTVGASVAQLEFGYTFSSDDTAGQNVQSHSWGEPLLRIGMLANWFELRLAWNYAEEITCTNGQRETVSGSEDMVVGAKFGLTPQHCILPEMAIITQMSLPTATRSRPAGGGGFGAGEVFPGINWLYSWEINDFLSTGGSTSFSRALDDARREPFLELAQSWTVAYTLTDNLNAYSEWFVIVPDGADTVQTQHFLNGGFTYLITDDVQFDIRAGVGLNDAADDYFVGAGLSIRFR